MLPGHDTVHTEFESDAAVVLLKLAQEFQPSSSPIKLGVLISTLHSSAAEILSRKGGGIQQQSTEREGRRRVSEGGGTSKTRSAGETSWTKTYRRESADEESAKK